MIYLALHESSEMGGMLLQLFSEYLKELIKKKGMTVSSLSRLSGVERTTLSKVLTGQRVLPYDSLELLAYHLRLTLNEEERFRQYYDMQFEKGENLRAREMISELFADLANLNFSAPAFEETRLLMSLNAYAGGRSIFSGNTNVQPLLRGVLAEEIARTDARVELTVPPSAAFINDEILRLYLNGKTPAITQITMFASVGMPDEISIHNLGCFQKILPVCLLSAQKYHPYYYYEETDRTKYMDPFPYFLLTHTCVVCLSEDCTQAMLLRKEDQVSQYHRHFQMLLSRCRSLIQYTSNPLEILNAYQTCTDSDGFYMIMDQPCFGRFYTEEAVNQFCREELPFYEQIVEAAQRRFRLLRSVEKFYTLFSASGIQRFAETGTLDDYPVAVVSPFPLEWRIQLLRKMAEGIRSGEVTGRLLEHGVFPDYLSMCTSRESGVGFFTTEQFPLTEGLCSVQIREPGLCQAFHDWLIHLPGGEKVLSTEETADFLKATADRLAAEERGSKK
ncbi:hypothetical protein B5E77_12965 [Lachnoclostridium sp. An131]|nr:hypothetical protein B5E77_12965 [Lachnoclostridium sp. An131]